MTRATERELLTRYQNGDREESAKALAELDRLRHRGDAIEQVRRARGVNGTRRTYVGRPGRAWRDGRALAAGEQCG